MSELRLGAGTDALTQVDLPQDWHARQLSDFCSFSQGGRLGLTKQEHYRSSGIPAYSAAGQDGYVDVAEFRDIDAVVLSAIGANCGRCFLAQGDWTTLANVQVIIPDAALADARFVDYRVNRDDYWPRSGSAQPFIKPSDMKACWIALPPVEQQKKIAQILDTLDTAIRETEALIDKLKAVKQGLLHDLLTRGIDANGQLRPPQSEAPQLYNESPLGWIPREWSDGPLGAWLNGKPKNGYSPQEAGEWTGVQMLGLGCLTKEGFLATQLKPAPAGDRGLERALLNEGDLLISRANTRELVGLVGVYRDVGTPCTYPDLMMRLMPSGETSSEFLQLVLQSSKVRRQIQAAASGTSESMVKISASIVTGLKVAIPKSDEQGIILCRTKALDGQLQSELQGLEVLRAIKAGLMDDLLTGRVRVTPLLESAQQLAAQTGA